MSIKDIQGVMLQPQCDSHRPEGTARESMQGHSGEIPLGETISPTTNSTQMVCLARSLEINAEQLWRLRMMEVSFTAQLLLKFIRKQARNEVGQN